MEIVAAHEESALGAVRELFLEYTAGLGFSVDFQNFEAELAELPGAYAPPKGLLLLALHNGEPAGCVGVRPLPALGSGYCEMKRLYVRPAYRGFSLGRLLARQALERSESAGYTAICLDTLRSMTAANALYDSMGFEERSPYYPNPLQNVRYLQCSLHAF